LEVATIYKAYFSGLNFREYPQKIWLEKWYVYVYVVDPEISWSPVIVAYPHCIPWLMVNIYGN